MPSPPVPPFPVCQCRSQSNTRSFCDILPMFVSHRFCTVHENDHDFIMMKRTGTVDAVMYHNATVTADRAVDEPRRLTCLPNCELRVVSPEAPPPEKREPPNLKPGTQWKRLTKLTRVKQHQLHGRKMRHCQRNDALIVSLMNTFNK